MPIVPEKSLCNDVRSIGQALALVTPASGEPVTLDQAKGAARVRHADQDDDFRGWIQTAREMVETRLQRAFLTQTWSLTLDRFPRWDIELNVCPVRSVDSIQYIDVYGVLQTLSPALYQVDTRSEPGRIAPVFGQLWPVTRPQTMNAVTVTFQAGYGTPAQVPQMAKQVLTMLVAHWFNNPEAFGQIDDKIGPTFANAMRLLSWVPRA